MKIHSGWNFVPKDIQKQEPHGPVMSPPRSFSDLMRQQEQNATEEQLKRMLEQIQKQGERLAKSMTVRELRQYRLMVKRFLEDTVRRGVGIKETRGFDRRGRTKRYKLLDEIDARLLEMADELLEHEQGRLEILRKIGEIQGLLINLLY
jgi:hypothetical protein